MKMHISTFLISFVYLAKLFQSMKSCTYFLRDSIFNDYMHFLIVFLNLRIHVGYCSITQIKKLFKNFYQEATDKDADNFTESIQRKKCTNISPAQIQAFLLLHRDDMNKAIKEASEI